MTPENLSQKPKEWLDKLKPYSKKDEKPHFDESALLVIDLQNFFLNEESHAYIPSAKTIIPNVKKIVSIFKKNSLPTIFTRFSQDSDEDGMMVKWWKDKVLEGSNDSNLIDELELDNDDIVIRKKNYSAFRETRLHSILKEKCVKTVVVTGVMTHLCCDTTARDAFMHGFYVYFVVDATASYNEDLHLASLKALSHGFAYPISTGDLVERIGNL